MAVQDLSGWVCQKMSRFILASASLCLERLRQFVNVNPFLSPPFSTWHGIYFGLVFTMPAHPFTPSILPPNAAAFCCEGADWLGRRPARGRLRPLAFHSRHLMDSRAGRTRGSSAAVAIIAQPQARLILSLFLSSGSVPAPT